MNEADIATRVAQNIPREEAPLVQTVPTQTLQPGEEGYVFDSPLSEVDKYRLYDFFDVPLTERGATREAEKYLNSLIAWAHGHGATNYHEVIAQIRELQQVLGSTDLKRLHRFVRIDATIKNAEAEMRNLYG